MIVMMKFCEGVLMGRMMNNAQLDKQTPMIDGFIKDPMVHENLETIPQKTFNVPLVHVLVIFSIHV